MYKCPNCGIQHEGYTCHACGYVDQGLKEHLEKEAEEAHIDTQRAKEQKEDNKMVSLHLCAMELYELQAALCNVPKSDLLNVVMDKVGLLVEGLQN